ncbi:periplasmic beta-glucosidase/beta-xylosidase [Emericellopsis cladophorae]|uniref:beta-glucosidase n=1 Tax=Emericellopsis cladophorae TaxID=2686198 RepID=A0A9P9Y6R2_9HYPO|nr:periplasmic beta-glucosidase/beta-xylosidase [Emericellopsis cladophorae]KAI6784441.1 periplasmic beta-glucosidase/beta-xylosidase [Emericellopsis cladophorae]
MKPIIIAGTLATAACGLKTDTPKPATYPYKDASLSSNDRVNDLLSRMSLAEKVGQMYHARYLPNRPKDIWPQVTEKHLTHFVYTGGVDDVDAFIDWYNELQQIAIDNTTLGIPITISTDPQHGWTQDSVASNTGMSFSRWPEPMGIVAMRSPQRMFEYGDIVDLATEPRWGRMGLTMGEDADLTTGMMLSMLEGLQGGSQVTNSSLVATVKHFPGGGPQEDGADPHYSWGRNQIYPSNNEAYHLRPFEAAIAAGVPQIMPYYSQPKGNDWEEVGFAFNKGVIRDLLQDQLGFEGIVLTDFGILTMTPWGVEDETLLDRTRLAIEAGCDIFGGETSTELLVQLVEDGLTAESRIDHSVAKLLKQKFELGLFDQPLVDKKAAQKLVGNEDFRLLGNDTQRRSFTLLTNHDNILPLGRRARKAKIYAEGIPVSVLESWGLTVVEHVDEADYAFLRMGSPKETPHPTNPNYFNNGTLEFNSTERARQAAIYSRVPTIVDIKAVRVPAIPEVAEQAAALFVSYGSSPEAFLDVVFGIVPPEGRLPFDMPRSDQAVEESFEDLQFDTKDPVFRFGDGLSYGTRPCIPKPRPRPDHLPAST